MLKECKDLTSKKKDEIVENFIKLNSINKLIEDTTLLFYHYAIEQGKEYYSKKKNYYLRKCAEKETKQAYQDNYIFSTNEDGNKNILKPLNFSRKSTSFLNSLNQKNSNNNLIVKIHNPRLLILKKITLNIIKRLIHLKMYLNLRE